MWLKSFCLAVRVRLWLLDIAGLSEIATTITILYKCCRKIIATCEREKNEHIFSTSPSPAEHGEVISSCLLVSGTAFRTHVKEIIQVRVINHNKPWGHVIPWQRPWNFYFQIVFTGFDVPCASRHFPSYRLFEDFRPLFPSFLGLFDYATCHIGIWFDVELYVTPNLVGPAGGRISF